MNNSERCEYSQESHIRTKGPKILRCTRRWTVTVEMHGEQIRLCNEHANLLRRMMKRRDQYKDLLSKAEEEQISVIEVIRQMRIIMREE